ncbi:MAG TPA: type 4a pilus biogenesis protein PilO [Candidatus Bathyarchaeia archaeon]|nr:type 4a pilus biogenesis protein PilO [Candidatus Bathyarchaeia archaeon]
MNNGVKLKSPAPKKIVPYPYLHLSVAIFFTLLFLGGIFLSSGKLISLSQKTAASRGQLTALRENVVALTALSQNLESVRGEITLLDKALPKEDGIVDFVKAIKGISREISLETFAFGSDQPSLNAAGNAYIDFGIEMKGAFPALRIFLDRFTNLPYIVKVQMVNLASIDQEEAQLTVQARIYVNDSFFSQADQ